MSNMREFADALKKLSKQDVDLLSDERPVGFVPSGCIVLDKILGGGFPMGRFTEIYGDFSTGKSLIAAQAIAVMQQLEGIAQMIDTESAVSLPIMRAVGVDIEKLLYSSPDTVEQVFALIEGAIDIKLKSYPNKDMIIVWDTIASTSSEAEMEKGTGEVGYLTHARIISQGLRKDTRLIKQANVCGLLLNQVRENIGVTFGDKETTFGGKAVSFHSSVRLRLKKAGTIKTPDKKIIGIMTKAIVVKNKVAEPFLEADLPIYFKYGIDDAEATYKWLWDRGVIIGTSAIKELVVNEGTLKFKKPEWRDVFNDNYDILYKTVMEG